MTTPERIQRIVDSAVRADRYNARDLLGKLERPVLLPDLTRLSAELTRAFAEHVASCVSSGLIRFAFLIEPVNAEVTSTKYAARWTSRLTAHDPRRADVDTCIAVLQSCCHGIRACLEDVNLRQILMLLPDWGLSPHETIVDYNEKVGACVHRADNVGILRDAAYGRLLNMRRILLTTGSVPDRTLFDAILDKVRVKSYLTDRALTGDYKTNREKRWEAHPASPQFALRRDCLMVELALLDQLVGFHGFPDALLTTLVSEGVSSQRPSLSRCPVTLDPMDFRVLSDSVNNPKHGKSPYQVGHLNPLKAGDSPEFRHAAPNVSWISEDGNRIQGYLPLVETQALLRRIVVNYEQAEFKKP